MLTSLTVSKQIVKMYCEVSTLSFDGKVQGTGAIWILFGVIIAYGIVWWYTARGQGAPIMKDRLKLLFQMWVQILKNYANLCMEPLQKLLYQISVQIRENVPINAN